MNAIPQMGIPPEMLRAESERPPCEVQSMETIGRLVSGVAHDFNNLLTGIVLCSDLLLAGLDQASQRRYVLEIRAAAIQGAGLVQQLSAAARPGPQESTVISFNQVIADIRSVLSRLIGENIDLIVNLAENLQEVQISTAHAQQIVLNLALNARDAMPDGGQIHLVTRNLELPGGMGRDQDHPESFIELAVSDTGIGMDAITRARIFEPFFTTKSAEKGTGLGLATVLGIVRQHGGSVYVESQPGQGTTVKVRLPIQEISNSVKGPES